MSVFTFFRTRCGASRRMCGWTTCAPGATPLLHRQSGKPMSNNNTSAFSIPRDDAVIERALQDASVPTLMMSMLHMSGDTSLLDGPIRPNGVYINEYQGFMSEEDKAAVRAQALQVIRAFRDGGCKLPPAPDAATVQRMMNFLIGQEVPADYVPMMMEEMELDGRDQRSDAWGEEVAASAREGHK